MAAATGSTDRVGIEAKVAFLRRPEAYLGVEPGRTSRVDVVETHMAWVFLTDAHAWKLKKPVRYPFLDFSTLEARRRDCLDEVYLNGRLAPDVYLATVPLTGATAAGLQIQGSGPVADWLVQMRRLPAESFLDALIRARSVPETGLAALAEVLERFYRSTAPEKCAGAAYRARLVDGILEDARLLADFDTDGVPARALSLQLIGFVSARKALLDTRARRVVEGHGDLRPEHVCLLNPPVVIDCLEFNREFRLVDPADELAFLAMECAVPGGATTGERILSSVCARLGDRPLPELLAFYTARRALLRARLALSHLDDVAPDDHARWRAKGQAYLDIARRCMPPAT